MKDLLNLNNVSAGYGKKTVLRDVSFSLKRGEFLGILGPNGSGKSTLLKVVSRIITPMSGETFFEDKNIFDLTPREAAQRIAFVSQDTIINFPFTVWEIVLMGRIPFIGRLKLETKKDFAIAKDALIRTNSLKLVNRNINELSAGERQRVIIAKALCQKPILLFLDEPTAHLDIGYQTQILDLLKGLNRQTNLTIVVVLHDLNLASEYCDRLILLNEGRIFRDGVPDKVLTYQNIETVYNTTVVVNKNPISSKPYITLVPREK